MHFKNKTMSCEAQNSNVMSPNGEGSSSPCRDWSGPRPLWTHGNVSPFSYYMPKSNELILKVTISLIFLKSRRNIKKKKTLQFTYCVMKKKWIQTKLVGLLWSSVSGEDQREFGEDCLSCGERYAVENIEPTWQLF